MAVEGSVRPDDSPLAAESQPVPRGGQQASDMGGYRFELSVHGRLVTPRHFDSQCIARAGSDLLWHNAVIDTAFARAWHRSQHDWRIQQLQAGNLKSRGAR